MKRQESFARPVLPRRPAVGFPFALLTELEEECAARFKAVNLPFTTIPPVYLSPANYFRHNQNAFYHYEAPVGIYFKETYTNEATPEHLASTMMLVLLQAAIHQHFDLSPITDDGSTYETAVRVARKMMGIEALENQV